MSIETPAGAGQPAPTRSAATGSPLRITTGVLSLVLSVWALLYAGIRLFSRSLGGPSTPFVGWMNFLIIVGAIGCLVTGIVILVKQRKRRGATPWLGGGFAAAVLAGAAGLSTLAYSGTPGGEAISIVAALAVVALSGLVIVLEKARG